MRSSLASVLLATVALPSVRAHYNIEKLIVNGNVTGAYEYVRQTTNSNSPITDITSDDMICNQGGLDADIMAKTSTYTVAPGDEVGFTINSQIGHPGPLSVWMSQAPSGTTAQDYTGSGDWFKVYELTTSSITSEGLQWATYVNGGINNFTFTLPSDLPAGDYLMRAEHIALHGASTFEGAQYYIGCAQLTVSGSGSGSPSPVTSIPGQYTGYEAGILINIYYPVPTNYTAPGISTWPNSCVDHTANFVDQTSDGDCTDDDGTSSGASTAAAGSQSTTSAAAALSSIKTSQVATTAVTPASAGQSTAAAAAKTSSTLSTAAKSTASAATVKASASSSAGSQCSSKKKRVVQVYV